MRMRTYYGTKRISARPMTRLAYNQYRGWELPADENGADPGYLVEYHDSPNSNHPDHAGYISWSPDAVFEDAYQPTDAMSFGHALQALKDGFCVARAGWNGKGMFICLAKGSVDARMFGFEPGDKIDAGHRSTIDGISMSHFACGDRGTVTRLPHIVMHTATGSLLSGWLASQTDMLAEDWCLVEPAASDGED